MITPPDDAKFLPEDYMDEMPPESRPVAEWIKRLPGGDAYALVGLAEASGDDPDDSAPHILKDGDVVLFAWSRSHGRAEIQINADGTWTVDRDLPAPVVNEQMMVAIYGDWETMAFSLKELVDGYLSNDPTGDSETLKYYAWSHASVPFEFRAGAFHQIEAA